MQEIADQTGFNSAEMMMDALEKCVAERRTVIAPSSEIELFP
jgi:glutathione synthase